MKLERFQEKDKKKLGIVIFTICCVFLIAGIFFYKTFAFFETKDNLNIIEGQVQGVGDVYFAFYIDDKISSTMPSKISGYVVDTNKTSCNNGAIVEWSAGKWAPTVLNMTQARTKCTIYFKTPTPGSDPILNGADPVVTNALVPVVIANDGTVKRADVSSKWYSYGEKQWANAVILKDENTIGNYAINEVIPESAIESYFVWIPRYRYKIFDAGDYGGFGGIDNTSVQTIEIEFETKDSPVSTGSAVDSWLTHPAFTAFNTNGMWVGKYETSKLTGGDNQRNGEAVQIKPNVPSWRNIQVGNAFYTSYDYKRDLDSHMMKNTEWGAVAYLQHSIYGSQQSVRINNNSSYITGYAANNEPTCGYTGTNEECNRYCNDGTCNHAFNIAIGYLASTTANITGIYDMAGSAWEYVMGVMLDQNGQPMSGRNNMYNSGFKGTLGCPTCDNDTSGITSITSGHDWPDKKYYDTYAYSTTEQQYGRRILGDATGEMGSFENVTYLTQIRTIGSWYADNATFVSSGSPWFMRGGQFLHGSDTGAFAFHYWHGKGENTIGFRVVLTP